MCGVFFLLITWTLFLLLFKNDPIVIFSFYNTYTYKIIAKAILCRRYNVWHFTWCICRFDLWSHIVFSVNIFFASFFQFQIAFFFSGIYMLLLLYNRIWNSAAGRFDVILPIRNRLTMRVKSFVGDTLYIFARR